MCWPARTVQPVAWNVSRYWPRDRTVLYALFAIDVVFIALAVLQAGGVLADPRFSLSRERSYPEFAQYFKYAWASVLLLRRAQRGGGASALLWSALFALLFADDAFAMHEHLGLRISTIEGLPSIGGIRPNQVGEVIVAAVEGGTFLIALALTLRSADADGRALSVALLVGLAALAGFGVAVDALDSLLRGHWFSRALGFVEDGGEMIAASLLAWIAWAWRPRRLENSQSESCPPSGGRE